MANENLDLDLELNRCCLWRNVNAVNWRSLLDLGASALRSVRDTLADVCVVKTGSGGREGGIGGAVFWGRGVGFLSH